MDVHRATIYLVEERRISSMTYRQGEEKGVRQMIILLVLLLVVLFFGLGFTAHFLFFVAAVLFLLWLAGLLIGRGENAGTHHFYRW